MGIVFSRLMGEPQEGARAEQSLLDGFEPITWIVIGMISLGGITVVAVLRFADNLLKGISMVFSLLLSGVVSLVLFQTQLGVVFCIAALIICSSVFLYQNAPQPPVREETRTNSCTLSGTPGGFSPSKDSIA